jgi:hypothetical protein
MPGHLARNPPVAPFLLRKSIQLKVHLGPPKWDVLFLALTRSLFLRRPGAAHKENLPNGSRSGSCPGISCYDHRPGASRHAFRQRGKRYSISEPRPLRRPGYVVVSPHPDAFFVASLVSPSTSALFSPIGSPCPALNQHNETTEVRAETSLQQSL